MEYQQMLKHNFLPYQGYPGSKVGTGTFVDFVRGNPFLIEDSANSKIAKFQNSGLKSLINKRPKRFEPLSVDLAKNYLMNHNISRFHIAVKNFEIVNVCKCPGHL